MSTSFLLSNIELIIVLIFPHLIMLVVLFLDHFMILDVISSAGTYIKEFVHSDLMRTEPSIKSIISIVFTKINFKIKIDIRNFIITTHIMFNRFIDYQIICRNIFRNKKMLNLRKVTKGRALHTDRRSTRVDRGFVLRKD